jgi:hypothetical protein
MSGIQTPRKGLGASWVHVACGAFIILWLDVGLAASTMNLLPSIVKIGVLGLWLGLAAVRSRPFVETFVVNAWPLPVMMGFTLLFAGEVAQSRQYTQGFGYLLIAFALLSFYAQDAHRREGLVLVNIMAADFAITGVRTLIAVRTDPELARYLATTEDKRVAVYGDQSFAGLGGYGLAYALAAVLLVVMFFLVRGHRHRAALGLVLIVGLVVLVELAFTTAIVLTIGLGVVFLVHDLVQQAALRVLIYAAALVGWVTGLYSAVLDTVADWAPVGDVVSQRLTELSRFLSGDSTTGSDLGTRLDHWSDSIEIFLNSGPLGLAGRTGLTGDTGGHSQWLDLVASYGLLAAFPLLFFLFAWKVSRRESNANGVSALKRVWLYFVVLGFINPLLFSTIVLTWMFFVPIVVTWLDDPAPARAISAPQGANV